MLEGERAVEGAGGVGAGFGEKQVEGFLPGCADEESAEGFGRTA